MYKRQPRRGEGPNSEVDPLVLGEGAEGHPVLTLGSVSYTHLDVYKRQVLDTEPLPRRQLAAPHQAAEPGEEGAGDGAALGDHRAVGGLQTEGSGHHERMVAAEDAPCMVGG